MDKYRFRQLMHKYLKEKIIQIYNLFGEHITDIIDGNKITYNPKTEIGYNLFYYGEFEKSELEICKKYINADSVVIDIGANIGIHTLFYSKLASDGFVISIEPSQETYALLLHNLIDAYNVLPLNIGAYDSTIISEFNVSSDNAYSSLVDTRRKTILKKQKILCCKLDDLFHNINLHRIDFIKIDVEGVEQNVLEGLEWVINTYKPVIFCEIYQGINSNAKPDDTVKYLIKNGYEAFIFCNNSLVKYVKHNDRYYNYFFIPSVS